MRIDHPAANRRFNMAVEAFQRGDYVASIANYREGLRIQPDHVPAYLDLAKAYENIGDFDGALDALEQALAREPRHPAGLRRLGRIREEKATFDAIAGRIRSEESLPFRRHFTVTLGRGIAEETGEVALQVLAQAYWKMGRVLEIFPTERLVVHLLPAAVSARRGWPLWTAGLAHEDDAIIAFIHGHAPHPGLLAALLRHEYAHVLVHEATHGRCPHWLNEAIAEALAKPVMEWERTQLDAALMQGRCLSLARLDRPFTELSSEIVSLAYRQCAVLGEYLFERHGPDAVRGLLHGLQAGWEIETLVEEMLGEPLSAIETRLFGRIGEPEILPSSSERLPI